MNTKHTPTPWHEGTRGPNNMPCIGARSILLAHVCTGIDFQEQADANAALIVRAVNSHEPLVTALRDLVAELARSDEEGLIEHTEIMMNARAALATAGVEP